ncbi:hypothetical protein CERSUDRAFT_123845 [Gelatoporia subvermispora B]|uniref:Structure-specific endonuclease subunit SLX1 C-terminal domain-containing protein n=1 Tax=Ceriporiopsis subvermispora (strain B) TaxID=914234 RepID=M2REB2_CERS8|nr:hypothetical protein CERSUDRAFT_123845 [Gelatoporia subvermispora B]
MIPAHPYVAWPLHVKLFSEEAVKMWNFACRAADDPLPRGFRCEEELEGVDGKSGLLGSGRAGPIEVKDTTFTASQMNKVSSILSTSAEIKCSICRSPVDLIREPLQTALCPTSGCTTISHLKCLSSDFLRRERSKLFVPRGGECRGCGEYTLWGDIIRGCYRRHLGAVPESIMEDDEHASDDQTEGLSDDDAPRSARQKQAKKRSVKHKGSSLEPDSRTLKSTRGRKPRSSARNSGDTDIPAEHGKPSKRARNTRVSPSRTHVVTHGNDIAGDGQAEPHSTATASSGAGNISDALTSAGDAWFDYSLHGEHASPVSRLRSRTRPPIPSHTAVASGSKTTLGPVNRGCDDDSGVANRSEPRTASSRASKRRGKGVRETLVPASTRPFSSQSSGALISSSNPNSDPPSPRRANGSLPILANGLLRAQPSTARQLPEDGGLARLTQVLAKLSLPSTSARAETDGDSGRRRIAATAKRSMAERGVEAIEVSD